MLEYIDYNGRIALKGDVIIGNIVTKPMYDYYVNTGRLKVLKRGGGKDNPSVVDFETAPNKFKGKVISMIGDPVKVLSTNKLAAIVKHDSAARDFFNDHLTPKDKHLPAERINEYIANAELLNAIGEMVSDKKAYRSLLTGTKGNVWKSITRTLSQLDRVKFPHSLPENHLRLKEKYDNYRKNGWISLIHSGYGNKNTEKINDQAKLWLLARWANMVDRVTSLSHLFALYNREAPGKGWKLIDSEQSIKNYLYSEGVKDLWWGYRYGELAAKEKFSMQHSTRMPSMRDSLWYSDGTKLNYFYLEDGAVKTCQVYEVMDAYSEVLLGYHISKSEDFEAQYAAYKMAAQFAGHRPYQLGFDNQGGHKKLENAQFLTSLAHLSIRTQPYNGKSKTIESAFGRFQEQFLKRDWFFTGQNIQSKKQESKANMEFVMANKANLPTLNEVKATYKQRRTDWNNAPYHLSKEPRLQMYLQSYNEKAPELNMLDMVDLFWMLRQDPVTVSAFGITFSEKKVKHTYLVMEDGKPDQMWLRKHIDKKVYIKFDPEDYSMVYLYEKDATGMRFLSAAEEKITVARGKQEQESFETAYIVQVNNENKRIRTERWSEMDGILAEHSMRAEDYGLKTPNVKGISKSEKELTIAKVQKKISETVAVADDDKPVYDLY